MGDEYGSAWDNDDYVMESAEKVVHGEDLSFSSEDDEFGMLDLI